MLPFPVPRSDFPFRDERAIRMTALKAHSMLKNAKELEFGFKIV
ncbi:hypothetical protein GOP47_0031238, partial [Adiantum capillus-veneris]